MASGLAFFAAIMLGNYAVPAEPLADDPAVQTIDNTFAAVQRQVRVERRVVVRITPFSARRAASELSVPDAKAVPPKKTRMQGGCVPLSQVVGVRLADGRRLLLYTRDRRVFSASFERSCPVQGFYSGFYVERPEDGMLCPGREKLHARSGVKCTLGGFAEMKNSKSKDD